MKKFLLNGICQLVFGLIIMTAMALYFASLQRHIHALREELAQTRSRENAPTEVILQDVWYVARHGAMTSCVARRDRTCGGDAFRVRLTSDDRTSCADLWARVHHTADAVEKDAKMALFDNEEAACLFAIGRADAAVSDCEDRMEGIRKELDQHKARKLAIRQRLERVRCSLPEQAEKESPQEQRGD